MKLCTAAINRARLVCLILYKVLMFKDGLVSFYLLAFIITYKDSVLFYLLFDT